MMRFEYQYDSSSPKLTLEIPDPDANLTEVLEDVERFLRVAGYVFDGELDIVNEEGN